MATKRMFARKIMESSEFDKLSILAQNLYVRIALAADDDGFIDISITMRIIGARQEEVDELVNEGFILNVPGNKKNLYHIKHWRTHNVIERTKYHPSDYKHLLKVMYPKREDYIAALPKFEREAAEKAYESCEED